MKTRRIYQPGYFENGQVVTLSADAARHVAVVLRMQAGEQVTLFGGDNREFLATITTARKNKVTLLLGAAREISRESPRNIHLAQAVSKGDRMEFVIQKAVELGVCSVTPLITEHCAVRTSGDYLAKKHRQWQAIAVAACEQSGRNQLPVIHAPSNLHSYLKRCDAAIKLVLCPSVVGSWRDYDLSASDIALLIGPEGGLSEQEIQQANQYQFKPLCLGPRVLRTETAALAAVSILQAVSGDL